jgi:hypothetical protein
MSAWHGRRHKANFSGNVLCSRSARATLKLWDEDILRLNRELNQLSISHEDLHQADEEKDAMIIDLQKEAETARTAFKTEEKQVEVSHLSLPFACWLDLLGSAPNFCFSFLVLRPVDRPWEFDDPGAGPPNGINCSQQELEELWAAALEAC